MSADAARIRGIHHQRSALRFGSPEGAPLAVPPVYLHPGHVVVSDGAGALATILGSCVAVCLHDPALGMGGMNHYLLPTVGSQAEQPGRYGPSAIDRLVESMLTRGASRERLVAYVVGGASVLAAYSDAQHLGQRNAAVAQQVLALHRIPIVGSDVGGIRGRKLLFMPSNGQVVVQFIGA